MKKTVLLSGLTLLLATTPAMAQMMEGGQHMYQQKQETPQQQNNPNQMNPSMMGGYGYGMGPGMMGGYGGYGMGPQMMGGYGMGPQMMGGYGMGPQMMGGYGYGMGHHMMRGYGMGPQMMGGYGMGHHMMGGYGMHSPYCGGQGPYFKSQEEYTRFLDETQNTRRKMHNLMFDYGEAQRRQEPDREKLQAMEKEMNELRNEISNYKTE